MIFQESKNDRVRRSGPHGDVAHRRPQGRARSGFPAAAGIFNDLEIHKPQSPPSGYLTPPSIFLPAILALCAYPVPGDRRDRDFSSSLVAYLGAIPVRPIGSPGPRTKSDKQSELEDEDVAGRAGAKISRREVAVVDLAVDFEHLDGPGGR